MNARALVLCALTAPKQLGVHYAPDSVAELLDTYRAEVLAAAAPPCAVCETPIEWVACPTGGWWAHHTHPADGHDALPPGAPSPAGVRGARDMEIVRWLGKKAREYRSTGSRQHALQADAIELMVSKIVRGAVRPGGA